jgi:hypothetical protein
MKSLSYGRRFYSFDEGQAVLDRISITEKALPGEDEAAFTRRLLKKSEGRRGTIEVIIKHGRPDYAIITFS